MLNNWLKTAEVNNGKRVDILSDMFERVKALKDRTSDLYQENNIFCKASACFVVIELG